MSSVSAILLLRAFVGFAMLYAFMRGLADWRDKKLVWATLGLVIGLAGAVLTFARLPLLQARIENRQV
jgi:H+/Cl- antiporter ClcA